MNAKARGRGSVGGREVSNFAYIGWKLETSGNENGNFDLRGLKKHEFVGDFERTRKPGKMGWRNFGVFFEGLKFPLLIRKLK
jgi:hypothetical protein